MTFNQLEYFCMVCRYHSITRAADALFISQPTISVALRNLEKEFGLQLFSHGKNQISLTPDGEAFYQKAERLLAAAQQFQDEFYERKQARPLLKIGIPPMLGSIFFPQLFTAFFQKYGFPVQLREYGSTRACRLVDTEELDAAVANLDLYNINHFYSHVMLEDQYMLCVSKDSPLAGAEKIELSQLGNMPLILFNTDSVQNTTILSRFHALHMTPKILMYSSQLSTTLRFVREGLGCAFLYRSTCADDTDLCAIPIDPPMTTKAGLVWKKGNYINEPLTALIRFVKKEWSL